MDELWFSSDQRVVPAKVTGALEGEARQALWDEQKAFMATFHERESKTEADS